MDKDNEIDGILNRRMNTPKAPDGLADRIIARTKDMRQETPVSFWAKTINDIRTGLDTIFTAPKPALAFASIAVIALGIGLFSGQIDLPNDNTSQLAQAEANTTDEATLAFLYDPDFMIEEWL